MGVQEQVNGQQNGEHIDLPRGNSPPAKRQHSEHEGSENRRDADSLRRMRAPLPQSRNGQAGNVVHAIERGSGEMTITGAVEILSIVVRLIGLLGLRIRSGGTVIDGDECLDIGPSRAMRPVVSEPRDQGRCAHQANDHRHADRSSRSKHTSSHEQRGRHRERHRERDRRIADQNQVGRQKCDCGRQPDHATRAPFVQQGLHRVDRPHQKRESRNFLRRPTIKRPQTDVHGDRRGQEQGTCRRQSTGPNVDSANRRDGQQPVQN